jgi:hypothetical protein
MNISGIIFHIYSIAVFGWAIFFTVQRFIRGSGGGTRDRIRLGAKTVLLILAAAVLSRVVLLVLSWGAAHVSGYGGPLSQTWSRWDAMQYLRIATQGYFDAQEGWIRIVFFPLYPAVVWLTRLIVIDEHIAALLVSWLCLGGACVYLYKLVLADADEKAARRAVKYLLIFPVTVFLGAPFSESMFLFLSLACLYHARTGRFWLACAAGALAALTRSVGVLLAVPVLLEMLNAHALVPPFWRQSTAEKLKAVAGKAPALLLIPLGTVAYLLMNLALTGDAFTFLVMQGEKWSQSFGSFANTLNVTFGQLAGDWSIKDKLLLWGSQLAVLLLGGAFLPVMAKKLHTSHSVYAIAYLFVVFAPTWLLSGFRYYMGLAVVFVAIAMLIRRRWANTAVTAVFALLMPVYTYAFTLGWLVF